MTLREAQRKATELGYTIKHDLEWEEYTVDLKGQKTEGRYHTNDIDDAYNTMLAMARERSRS